MQATVRNQQAYDHRLKLYVHKSGDVEVAKQLDVPRSTVHGWRKGQPKPVISHVKVDQEIERLNLEATKLRNSLPS